MVDVLMAGPEEHPQDVDTSTDQGLVNRVKKHWKLSRDHSHKWREESRKWYRFRDGDQWEAEDEQVLREQLRPIVTFNRVAPIIDAVSGQEISNRKEVQYIPREQGDVQQNELYTGAAEWIRDLCDAEDEESDAFTDALICGMGWTETRMDYEEDLDGQVKIERVDPFEMHWDPYAKKRNLSDANWVMHIKEISKEDFEAFWPGKLTEVFMAPWDHPGTDEMGHQWNANEPDEYATSDELEWDQRREKNSVKVAHYQWWEREPVYRVEIKGEVQEVEPRIFNKMQAFLDEAGARYVKQTRKVFKRAFLAGEIVLEKGPCPCKYGFTFRAMTAKRNKVKNTWYGMVKAMVDPQMWANKFFSQIQHILNSNAKGGVMADTDAVENVREFEEKWAKSDSVIWTTAGAMAKGKIQPKPQIAYPQGIDRLMEFAIRAHFEVTGVNLEMLGMADKVQPGVLEFQRKQAGMAILAVFFDAQRRYRKEQGRVLLFFIQEYVSDGRLVKITGDQDEYVPLNREESALTYDIIVEESPTSPNQKEKTFAIMQELLPTMGQMGIPPPPSFLEYSPLPSKVAQDWAQLMDPELQQQMQQMQEQIEQMQEQAQEYEEALEQLGEENEQLKGDQAIKFQELGLEKEIAAEKQNQSREEMDNRITLAKQKAVSEKEALAAKTNLAEDEQEHEERMAMRKFNLEEWKARRDVETKRLAARSNGAKR